GPGGLVVSAAYKYCSFAGRLAGGPYIDQSLNFVDRVHAHPSIRRPLPAGYGDKSCRAHLDHVIAREFGCVAPAWIRYQGPEARPACLDVGAFHGQGEVLAHMPEDVLDLLLSRSRPRCRFGRVI